MKHNNRLGSDYGDLPMPENYEGGSKDFGVTRIVDGHRAGEPLDYGHVGAAGRNTHYPSSSHVTSNSEREQMMEEMMGEDEY